MLDNAMWLSRLSFGAARNPAVPASRSGSRRARSTTYDVSVSDPKAEPEPIDAGDTVEESEDKSRAWPWVETVLDGLSGVGCSLNAALAAVPAILVVVWLWSRAR